MSCLFSAPWSWVRERERQTLITWCLYKFLSLSFKVFLLPLLLLFWHFTCQMLLNNVWGQKAFSLEFPRAFVAFEKKHLSRFYEIFLQWLKNLAAFKRFSIHNSFQFYWLKYPISKMYMQSLQISLPLCRCKNAIQKVLTCYNSHWFTKALTNFCAKSPLFSLKKIVSCLSWFGKELIPDVVHFLLCHSKPLLLILYLWLVSFIDP